MKKTTIFPVLSPISRKRDRREEVDDAPLFSAPCPMARKRAPRTNGPRPPQQRGRREGFSFCGHLCFGVFSATAISSTEPHPHFSYSKGDRPACSILHSHPKGNLRPRGWLAGWLSMWLVQAACVSCHSYSSHLSLRV